MVVWEGATLLLKTLGLIQIQAGVLDGEERRDGTGQIRFVMGGLEHSPGDE